MSILYWRKVPHKDLAIELMGRLVKDLDDLAIVDREATVEGKSVIMILSPNPIKGKVVV